MRKIQGGDHSIHSLMNAEGELRDITVEDAVIRGPAILHLISGGADMNTFASGASMEDYIWEVDESRRELVGAVPSHNTTFRRCRFVNVGLALTPDEITRMQQNAYTS